MKKNGQTRLPVLMHHIISNDTSHIAVRPAIFEEQCRMLAEQGWFGISLEQAEDFLINGAPLPKKSFLMTFDDGYLDNYIYAMPIMKKYGHKGVVFAVADRISHAQNEHTQKNGPNAPLRPTLDDIWNGRCTERDFPSIDTLLHTNELGFTIRKDLFFTWDEARYMEKSGVLAIAGHSVRHEGVFISSKFTGFHQPGDSKGTFYQTPPLCWGMPRFEGGPELASKAFIPSPELIEAIKKLVPQDEAEATHFFRNESNVATLRSVVARFENALGSYETNEEQQQRMFAIMQRSQDILRHELGHAIKSFCWPWGGYCTVAREQGQAAGFEVFYTTKLGMNPPASPLAVHRFKVKDRADAWLPGRVRLYSSPILGALYLKMRL